MPITKTEIMNQLAFATGLKKKEIVGVIEAFVDLIVKNLKKDKDRKFKAPGLGIFQVKNRPARMGRNPKTGEAIKIKAKTVLRFRVSKDLKGKVL